MGFGDLSWTDVQERDIDTVLLPTGSVEQHGPHAPLKTDILIAEELAEAAATETKTYTLPSASIGISDEHNGFPGTLAVSPDTFRAYISDVLESVASTGISNVIVVNGHGGNVHALREVCDRFNRDDDLFALEWTWWRAVDGRMGHAGALETAILLHLAPDLVDEDAMEAGEETWGERAHGARIAHDSAAFTDNGVVGDPREAAAEQGERLFMQARDELVNLVNKVENRELEHQ